MTSRTFFLPFNVWKNPSKSIFHIPPLVPWRYIEQHSGESRRDDGLYFKTGRSHGSPGAGGLSSARAPADV